MTLFEKLEALNNKKITNELRGYLGLSMSGHSCSRYLQYYHYWAFRPEISARIARLFTVGHEAEAVMIADLALAGIYVTDAQKGIIGAGGHWRGHIDGLIHDGSKLIEFKTHNDKSFKDLVKKGVDISKPTHYAQMNAYMDGLGVYSALYMAMNKNTSEYYFELIDIDYDEVQRIKERQNEVLIATDLIEKIGNGRKSWFECKFCDARDVCHNNKPVLENCRTCRKVDILDDGEWQCSISNKFLSLGDQKIGCNEYEKAVMFGVDE